MANKLPPLKDKRVLLLQGPMGNFFKRLDKNFRKRGAITYRIGFNKGDEFYSYSDNYTPFKGKPMEWGKFILDFLEKNRIDIIFLIGDCRFYQKITRSVTVDKNIIVFVFEYGYIRPHYITLERDGVNNFSKIPREPSFYNKIELKALQEARHSHSSRFSIIISSIIYYFLSNICYRKYPHYQHHRDFLAYKEAFFGIRGAIRKELYKSKDEKYLKKITQELSKKYYFIPIQTHNDFQIREHSKYEKIEDFMVEVIDSFSKFAPKETFLIFKHHPEDRGRKNYKKFLEKEANKRGVLDKIIVVYDTFLPDCLENAKATVTINSTVGLTSISKGIATITLGDAIYDMEGLTTKTTLNDFWNNYKTPNHLLYLKFQQYLIETTQLNGSMYGIIPEELK